MYIATAIILFTFGTQAQATVDGSADKIFDRMITPQSSLEASLEDTTLGKAAIAQTRPRISSGAVGVVKPPVNAFIPSAIANRPNVQANALRGTYQPMSPLASQQSQTCRPQMVQGLAPPVPAVQNVLKGCGVGSSPLEELALTAIAGTRDVSMAARANRMFQNLDAKTHAQVKATMGAVNAIAANMSGATDPMGYWDPWGLSMDVDENQLIFMREIELKHGRIGMIATLGMVAGETLSPIFGGKPGVPAAFAMECTAQPLFWLAALIGVAYLEGNNLKVFGSPDNYAAEAAKNGWTLETRTPGDVGFDPLKFKDNILRNEGKNAWKLMQEKELNNGRLAMLAAAGIVAQELVTQKQIFR